MYLTAKALHLIFMVAWFAGLFYMFRLFVYHTENKDNADRVDLLKIMSHRLYYYITTPAMIVTWSFGLTMLAFNPGYLGLLWMKIKLVLITVLTAYHFFIGYTLKRFKEDDVFLNSKQCRLWNEAPTPLLIAIILLAVFRWV